MILTVEELIKVLMGARADAEVCVICDDGENLSMRNISEVAYVGIDQVILKMGDKR